MRFFEVSTLYVSNKNDGKKYNGYYPEPTGRGNDGPFFSFEEALTAVNEIRGGGALQPLTIKIVGGEYFLKAPVSIVYPASNLTLEPYKGEEVTLNGGRKITGFEKTTFNGVACLGAYVEDVKKGEWNFTDLYVNGKRAKLSRYPENGFFKIVEAEDKGEGLYDFSKWFIAKKEDLNPVENIEDCILSFCHYWIDEHTPIESYDRETGKLVMKYYSRFNITHNFQYYLENVPSTFSKPGEWYLDRKNGMVYYIPENGDFENISVYAPELHSLMDIGGEPDKDAYCRSIRVRNIKFRNTRGDYGSTKDVFGNEEPRQSASDAQGVSNASGTANIYACKNVTFENCVFENYGLHGINVGNSCSDIKILKNVFYDGGAGGVKVDGGEAGRAEVSRTRNIEISDNLIERCGRRYLSACGILVKNSFNCKITHNHITDLFYTGISVGWTWGYKPNVSRDNLISKNHIHNIGQGVLSDMGGIYLLGAQPGTVVSYNLIHDVKSLEYGGWAIYNDEGSSGITVENNVCYDVSENCYHMNYGTSNLIRNNIFAKAGCEIMRVTLPEKHLGNVYENNIIYTSGVPVHRFEKPQLDDPNFICRNNLIFDSERKENVVYINEDGFRSLSEIKEKGMEEGSVVADPLFRDPAHGDFALSENSPAFSVGFVGFDISDVGIRK